MYALGVLLWSVSLECFASVKNLGINKLIFKSTLYSLQDLAVHKCCSLYIYNEGKYLI